MGPLGRVAMEGKISSGPLHEEHKMTLHHYVPVSVISNFASAEAWRLVNASDKVRAKIASIDAKNMTSGNRRKFPICVYDKISRTSARKLAKDVCSQQNLYKVVKCDDKAARDLLYSVMNLFTHERFRDKSLAFASRDGKTLDPEFIEKIPVGYMDGRFAGLFPRLVDGQELNDDEAFFLLQFLAFARFRTPVWRRVYFPQAWDGPIAKFKRRINKERYKARLLLEINWANSLGILENIADGYFYNMSILLGCNRDINAFRSVGAKILVLHTKASMPFVTCDNPARPYYPDRIRGMLSDDAPGVADSKAQIVYPIEPKCCLLVSSNPSFAVFAHDDIEAEQARAINTALAIMADKEIVLAGPHTSVFESWLDLDKLEPIPYP